MKYTINYTNEGKISGFAKGETDLNIEVSNSVWFEAINGGYNKIIIDGSNISFDKVDWRTPEEIAEQQKAQRKADFTMWWEALTIEVNGHIYAVKEKSLNRINLQRSASVS